MSKCIWKYQIGIADGVVGFDMPEDTRIVEVHSQDEVDVLTFWAEVDPTRTKTRRYFGVVGTGHEVQDRTTYIGSMHVPPFVWHLYEAHVNEDL